MTYEPRYKTCDFYTTLRLGVANAKNIAAPRPLSKDARCKIKEAILRHAEHLIQEADLIDLPGATVTWNEDNTITVTHKNGDDEEFTDTDLPPKVEPSAFGSDGDTDFVYKNAIGTHLSAGSERVFLLEEQLDTPELPSGKDYVMALPVIRITGALLLSVNIPTNRVDIIKMRDGTPEPWDLTEHPVIKKENRLYRILYLGEPDMVMYYDPITNFVYDLE